jgi:hypothetical protein
VLKHKTEPHGIDDESNVSEKVKGGQVEHVRLAPFYAQKVSPRAF